MRISRVYTGVGDRGTTRLVGGSEVAKDDARVESYGSVDELNAIVGLVRTVNASTTAAGQRLEMLLRQVQNDLFNVGADLATPAASRWEGMVRVGRPDIQRLEAWIDELNGTLPPLTEFILPGGGPVSAHLHQARTVCRRAERRTTTLTREDPSVGEDVLIYLNRLSDLLFVLGRWVSAALGEPEYLWDNPNKK